MDRICKWSVRYDGESGALEFIARVEELCEVYDLPTDIMPRIVLELLHGKAANWYRNNRRDLMRHLNYTAQQRLDRIARNSRREYQLFFGDTSSKDLSEMIVLGERFEYIPTVATTPPLRVAAERRKPPPDAVPKTVEMTGRTLVASLTIGGLATRGDVDTGATRSIIREDFIGFIPHIINSETRSHIIRMVDGASQDSKRSITVEVKIGDMSFNVKLLVLRRSVDHLTLDMDFLAKTRCVDRSGPFREVRRQKQHAHSNGGG
uniref:Uncharacterized protein n=1 Tax=Glossina palpalis gambiensis TaxID=67801 RepID=A0A1B0BHX2_9MUSC